MHSNRWSRWMLVIAICGSLVLLGGPASLLGRASASPSAGSSAGSVLWAYGAEGGSTASAVHNGTYEVRSVYFGWHVVLTQTNLTATTFELEVVRTMGFTIYATFCNPNCAHPILYANLSAKAWERSVGFANFTTTGTVELNGSAVPALAILNDHASVTANLTESLVGTVHRLMGTTSTASGYFYANEAATVAVDFTPALGLVPIGLGPDQTWSSTSRFAATGSWLGSYLVTRTGFNGTPIGGQRVFSGSANGSGNITVQGAYAGSELLDDGALTSAVHLAITGPFDVREGILLIPIGANLFGGAGHDLNGTPSTAETADTSALDLSLRGVGHFGLLASATGYSGAVANPNQPGATPSVTSSGPSSGVQLQGQPESVQQAQQGSNCLLTSSCPAAALPPGAGGFVGGLVAAFVLSVAVIGLLLLVAARRRPVRVAKPPTQRSYPTGAAASPPPARDSRADAGATTSEADAAPDPLDHLW